MKRTITDLVDPSAEPRLAALVEKWNELAPRFRKARAVYDETNRACDSGVVDGTQAGE